MLSKCANPECSAPFLYLHQGRLFRFDIARDAEADATLDPELKKSSRHIEFFWLCNSCSGEMTLTFDNDTIEARPQKYAKAMAS